MNRRIFTSAVESFPVTSIDDRGLGSSEAPMKTPAELTKEQKRRMTWLQWLIIALLLLALVLAISLSFMRDSGGVWRGGLRWLFEYKAARNFGPIEDVAKVLAPITALALAIERVIETIFDIFEQSIYQVSKLGSGTVSAFQWLNVELRKSWEGYQNALLEISSKPPNEKLLETLEKAKDRISQASNQLEGLKQDPKYLSTKRSLSIWMGISLCLIVAVTSDEGLFEFLNISVPRLLDMIVTGLVIGAGSSPMHSLVGILQGGRDALSSLSAFWESRSVTGNEIANEKTGGGNGK
jgi:hypothetical protein